MSSQNYEPQGNHQQPPPPQNYGPQQHQVPPPPQDYGQPQPLHQPPKKSMKVPIIIAVIVIVVIAAVAGAFLLMGGRKQSSPENVLEAYVDAYNNGDYTEAFHLTDAHFLPESEFEDQVDNAEEYNYEDSNPKILSMETEYLDEMSSDDVEDIEDSIDEIEDELDITIDDFAKVEFRVEYEYDTETDTDSGEVYCIKVDGKWYLCIYLIGIESEIETTPVGVWQSVEPIDSDTVKLSYGTFSSDIEPNDIEIIISDYSTTITLSITGDLNEPTTTMAVSGGSGISAVYSDLNYEGNTVNAGDFITIDGLDSGTAYSVLMFHVPTSATIMGGDEYFTTP
ncbi:MAG: hypothetical protein PHU53_07100 [Thermoplasmata archaeon]|nr:hypothetical protein [Thermoplasmata archaeon]